MAQTRGATGHARPRVFASIDTAPANPRKTTTKRKTKTGAATKKSLTGAGVKKRAPNTHHKRKPTVADKVTGTVKKAIGKVQRKPGKVGAGTKQIKGTDGKGSRAAKK